jgi:hypothetical protein
MSYKFRSLQDLESVFIEKISEKYKLNERDLKKAFIKFDYDGNGLLDLNELGAAVRHYVNGVHQDQVQELMNAYDQNEDGMISYEELLYNFNTRTATKSSSRASGHELRDHPSRSYPRDELPADDDYEDMESEDISERYSRDDDDREDQYYHQAYESKQHGRSPSISSSLGANSRRPSTASSTAPSELDQSNPHDFQYRAKIFFQSLRQMLLKNAVSSAVRSASGGRKPRDHLLLTHQQYLEKEGKLLLFKYFEPYLSATSSSSLLIEYNDFCRVLRGLKLAGSNGLRAEVMDYIFNLCSVDDNQNNLDSSSSRRSQTDRVIRSEHAIAPAVADVQIFASLLFGDANATEQDVEKLTYPKQLDAGRKLVGMGPFSMEPTAAGAPATSLELASMPIRVVAHKTKASLKAPAAYNSQWLIRSAQSPNFDVGPAHVLGMSASLQSGNAFHLLSNANAQVKRSSPAFLDHARIAYASAALGVVHDLSTNSQSFYRGHHDDITCMAISMDCTIAATGCVASTDQAPLVHIWSTEGSCSLIRIIGQPADKNRPRDGFFLRSVNALCFSADNFLLIAVGCDDRHCMGIFEVATGELLIESSIQHGLPPQIAALVSMPTRCRSDYITRQHSEICDVFATAGDHHLRLWSFRRPTTQPFASASLDYIAPTVSSTGKVSSTLSSSPPKVYTCCQFLAVGSSSSDTGADLVAGGSNGYVYLYRQGKCIAGVGAVKGGVTCITVLGSVLICGGASGLLKLLDGRTLSSISSIDIYPAATPGRGLKSSASSQRPRSASSARSSSRRGSDDSSSISSSSVKAAPAASDANCAASSVSVTGIVAIAGSGRVAQQAAYALVSLSSGVMLRVALGSHLSSSSSSSSSAAADINPLFWFHSGSVYGLAVDRGHQARVLATSGDDRRVLVWDISSSQLLAEATGISAAGRCLCFDPSSAYVAVGDAAGGVTIYHLQESSSAIKTDPWQAFLPLQLVSCVYRRDSREEISAVAFAPSSADASALKLAVGSHDNLIYIYIAYLHAASAELVPVARLSGHSSFLRQIDWSCDGLLLQSTSGANDLL